MIRDVVVAVLLPRIAFDSKDPKRLHGVRSVGRNENENENADARKDLEECSVVARMGMQRNVIRLLIDTS
jgi:hypothetical protein